MCIAEIGQHSSQYTPINQENIIYIKSFDDFITKYNNLKYKFKWIDLKKARHKIITYFDITDMNKENVCF